MTLWIRSHRSWWLLPIVAAATLLPAQQNVPSDSWYALNSLLLLATVSTTILGSLTSSLAALRAAAVRRRPSLGALRLASARSSTELAVNDLVPIIGIAALVVAGAALAGLLVGGHGFELSSASIIVWTICWLALCAAVGRAIGRAFPWWLSPLIAALPPYACYLALVRYAVEPNNSRFPFLDAAWAPTYEANAMRLLVASACAAFATIAVASGVRGVAGIASLLLAVAGGLWIAQLSPQPGTPFYARSAPSDSACVDAEWGTSCVLARDRPLLKDLTRGQRLAAQVLDDIAPPPTSVNQIGVTDDGRGVPSDVILEGHESVAAYLLSEAATPPEECREGFQAPDGTPWLWVISGTLHRQAGIASADPYADLPSAAQADWLKDAMIKVQRCEAPKSAPVLFP